MLSSGMSHVHNINFYHCLCPVTDYPILLICNVGSYQTRMCNLNIKKILITKKQKFLFTRNHNHIAVM